MKIENQTKVWKILLLFRLSCVDEKKKEKKISGLNCNSLCCVVVHNNEKNNRTLTQKTRVTTTTR